MKLRGEETKDVAKTLYLESLSLIMWWSATLHQAMMIQLEVVCTLINW